MSKLAHSHQPTMDALDVERAIDNGDEDWIGLKRLPEPPRCEGQVPPSGPRFYRERRTAEDGWRCRRYARFQTSDGKVLCRAHAEEYATKEPAS